MLNIKIRSLLLAFMVSIAKDAIQKPEFKTENLSEIHNNDETESTMRCEDVHHTQQFQMKGKKPVKLCSIEL
jgi:hypothetical protein